MRRTMSCGRHGTVVDGAYAQTAGVIFRFSSGSERMIDDLTRRDVMKGGAAAALVATSAPLQQAAAQGASVSGVVFEDRSGSGRRQPGDPGIPGVLVSNGREVAKTDANGRYSLPIEEETAVFVIKPTGWMVPVEPGTILPRFY